MADSRLQLAENRPTSVELKSSLYLAYMKIISPSESFCLDGNLTDLRNDDFAASGAAGLGFT